METNHGPRPDYPSDLTVLDLLASHAAATPDALALVALGKDGVRTAELSFAETQAAVEQAAGALAAATAAAPGAEGARWVMVVLPEGLEQVLAVWAVLRAGCGYVPVDAATQAPRLRMLFEETSPVAVVGVPGGAAAEVAAELGVPLAAFPEGGRGGLTVGAHPPLGQVLMSLQQDGAAPPLLPLLPAPDDLALLLYSSGSTGVPKGIIYDHRWLMGGSWFVGRDMELSASSHCLLRCSYVWSVSLYDLFPATMVGGTLFIPPPGGHKNVQFIAETIERETIHAVVIQPTLLNLLLDEHTNSASYPLRSLRHVVSSGEKLFTSTAEAFKAAPGLNARLWNMYGATEAGCTYFSCAKGEERKLAEFREGVPAGLPQSHVDVFIMRHDADGPAADALQPVPTGETGEICFGGGGDAGFLARGYWRQPLMTDEKFVRTRYGRLYRTGDAGRWCGGQVVVEGRLDRQVKIRGVRIQPESIEAVVKRYADESGAMPVKACLVVPSGAGEAMELTAFVETSASDTRSVDTAALLSFLRQELGRLYVPRTITHLVDGLPRTPSGKPDQNILKAMATEAEGGGSAAELADSAEDGHSEALSVLGAAVVTGSEYAWSVDVRAPMWRALKDHKYRSEAICPGSAFVTLASEACRALGDRLPDWELRDLAFSRPLPLASPRLLRVEAVLTASGASIRISSSAGGSDEGLGHCTCEARRLNAAPGGSMHAAAPQHDDADRRQYSVEALYAQLADGGFDYGAQFRVLRSLEYSGAGGELPAPETGLVKIRGVAFDMDGTLVDTEHVHLQAWNLAYKELFGLGPFSVEWFDKWVGKPAPCLAVQFIADHPAETGSTSPAELLALKEANFVKLAGEPGGPVSDSAYAGIAELLAGLRRRNVPVALCTSSARDSCDAVLAGAGLGALLPIDLRVTLTDVREASTDGTSPAEAKPHPRPYLMATGKLRLEPAVMAAVEDSPSGVRSAKAAGYGLVVGVLTTQPAAVLLEAGADALFGTTCEAAAWIEAHMALTAKGVTCASGELVRQRDSPFLLDPITMDGCFQMAPLVSMLGFQGAPTAIKRVRWFAECPDDTLELLTVSAEQGPDGIDFRVSAGGVALFAIEGLALQAFDTLPPEALRVESAPYEPKPEVSPLVPRVIAVGARARGDADAVAKQLGATEVCTWPVNGAIVELIPLRSAVLVVRADEHGTCNSGHDPLIDGVVELFPSLGFELPYRGRVWLVVVGSDGDKAWQCAARAWAAAFPALLLSTLSVDAVDAGCKAVLLASDPPACVDNGTAWRLALPSGHGGAGERNAFAGMDISAGSSVAVLSAEANPLAMALLAELSGRGASVRLVLPGQAALGAVELAVLCAVGSDRSVTSFDSICADASRVVTVASMAALLPSAHSLGAVASARAAAASKRRSIPPSMVIYVPPLMGAGLWVEPPAPAGLHRCTVEALVQALGAIGAAWNGDAIVGTPGPSEIPKHFAACTTVSNTAERGAAEVQAFLLAELAESLAIDAGAVSLGTGLTDLGVTSLATLRLSQRLRRFLGREFSAFALQNNPTVAGLVEALTRGSSNAAAAPTRGTVLCLHGFRTSSTVLSQQMLPLHRILDKLGYSLAVPNGVHMTTGPAQFAEGLDDKDSYGWWTYADGDESHDGAPIGLEASVEMLAALGPVAGIVGFSQGGAVAAQLASALRAPWALLFSPVHVPGKPARCECPTLVAYDRADEVFGATQQLLAQLPHAQQLEHEVGHRLPPEGGWWAQVESFVASTAAPAAVARPTEAPSNTTSSEGQDVEHQPGPAATSLEVPLAIGTHHSAGDQLPPPMHGLTLGALRRLTEHPNFEAEMTTERVLHAVIMQETTPAGWALTSTRDEATTFTAHSYCEASTHAIIDRHPGVEPPAFSSSYCDLLVERGAAQQVGAANRFVSHAWKIKFLDMLACLENAVKDEDASTIFFWLDVCVLNQHEPEKVSKGFSDAFKDAVQAIGHTILVWTPVGRFVKPEVITRIWCIWEIFCTVESEGCDLTLGFRVEDADTIGDTLAQAAANIDCRRAQASSKDDKTKILQAVAEGTGAHRLNLLVLRRLYLAALPVASERGRELMQNNMLVKVQAALIHPRADMVLDFAAAQLPSGRGLYMSTLVLAVLFPSIELAIFIGTLSAFQLYTAVRPQFAAAHPTVLAAAVVAGLALALLHWATSLTSLADAGALGRIIQNPRVADGWAPLAWIVWGVSVLLMTRPGDNESSFLLRRPKEGVALILLGLVALVALVALCCDAGAFSAKYTKENC